MKLVLLPGMDGTGSLFAPLLEALPDWVEPAVMALPTIGRQDQLALAEKLAGSLPTKEDYFLLGESFSGRIAFELALTRPPGLKGVIYAASFLIPPKPWLLPLAASLPLAQMIKYPPASGAARHMMLGRGMPSIWSDIRDTVTRVRADLISDRLAALCDVTPPDGVCDIPSLRLLAIRDRLVDRKAADSLAAHSSRLTTKAVEGPHFLLQAQPQKCAEEIMDFMAFAR